MIQKKLGFCVCGSFCTFSRILSELETLCAAYHITPILSEASSSTDTRFGEAAAFRRQIETVTARKAITTIPEAEPIGPAKPFDAMIVAPCTGNTLSRLAAGMADSTVSMACKAHLRNERPLILAISTNDGLSANAANIGTLLGRRLVYFVPFTQDDPEQKPNSLVANFSRIAETTEAALEGRQLQPLLGCGQMP